MLICVVCVPLMWLPKPIIEVCMAPYDLSFLHFLFEIILSAFIGSIYEKQALLFNLTDQENDDQNCRSEGSPR